MSGRCIAGSDPSRPSLLPSRRRFVGDPTVRREADRQASLYGAAMLRKIGRLPDDLAAVDVHFEPPACVVFVAADASQAELARFVIPARVLEYRPHLTLEGPIVEAERADTA